MKSNPAATMDEYIAGYPDNVQQLLQEMRTAIRQAAPEAEEAIKYGIPTFVFKGNLVHFGAFKNHIGFYPAPRGITEFKKELSLYDGDKSTVRFPIDKSLPLALITKMVKFRVQKNLEKVIRNNIRLTKFLKLRKSVFLQIAFITRFVIFTAPLLLTL